MVSANKDLFDEATLKNVNAWLDGGYDEETKEQIRTLMKENPEEIVDSFYRSLEFGTGGLRGVMGIGSNRMNRYTVMSATQAFANYLLKQEVPGQNSIFITYDSRNHSQEFATAAAQVFAGNGIKAYIFKELRPLPLVSFACRFYKCQGGIMLTASHCTKEYNGYKVFWNDGAQVLPPHDIGIINEVKQLSDIAQVKSVESPNHPLIEWIGEEVDLLYLEAIQTLQHYPEDNGKLGEDLHIVYTSLHGAGSTLVPKALESWGFKNLSLVEEQKEPNGDFPTVTSPNPEEHAALAIGIKQMCKEGADLLIGTDPDTDRVGAAVLHKGETVLITGNQMAALCTAHVCESLSEQGRLPVNGAFVKTIVTTELIRKVAEAHQQTVEDVLTGFKYIAEKIRNWENAPDGKQFLFGGEESYGYLLGTHVRDKDAVVSACLICEVALKAKLNGQTLVDKLHALYRTYGIHHEELVNLKFPESKEGTEQREQLMKKLRGEPPKEMCGIRVERIEDYKTSSVTSLVSGETSPLPYPVSNVLRYWLEDGTKLTVRPSGTEPKVKLYVGVVQPFESDMETELAAVEKKAYAMGQFFKNLL